MKVDKKEAEVLDRAIEKWEEDELIDTDLALKLKDSYESTKGDYRTLTFYAFIAAVSCAILAFGALVLDEKWIERMRTYFAFSEFTIGFMFAGLTALFVWMLRKRKKTAPTAQLANESLSLLIALSASVSIAYFGKAFGQNERQYYYLIFAAAIAFGALGYLVQSRLLWTSMIAAFCGWFAGYTYEAAINAKGLFLGMNMPLRLTLFCAILLLLSAFVVKRFAALKYFHNNSYYVSWALLLFTAWLLSIFGHYDLDLWFRLKQSRVLFWAIGYTLFLVAALFYAIKQKDNTLRDMVLLFLIVNIYTRYFEYFWDITNKGLFFAIMALSFWFVGKKLEQYRKHTDPKLTSK